jgi:hypothetical protein
MRGTGGTSIGRRAFLRGTLAATLAWPWVRDAAGEVEVRRGSFSARASILYGMFRLDERGVIEETVDRAAGRYETRIQAQGADMSTDIESRGALRHGRWSPLRFRDRIVVHGRESRLDIAYDPDRGTIRYQSRSETFLMRRVRAVDDVVPIPAGVHVDDALSAMLNFAEGRWPTEPDGSLLTRIVRRRRGAREGSDDVERTYQAELVPFELRVTGAADRPTARFDMTRFSSWARDDEPARIVFGPDRRPESITATLMLGTSIDIRIAAERGVLVPAT